MQYNQLGQTGMQVSVIALGCWPFAGGDVWGSQDDAMSISTVHAALDAGINFFDTAEGYGGGHAEEILGQGLKGRRDQAIIATKVSPHNLAAAQVILACERSLRAIQTDYIDLYQIHWPNWEVPLAETVEALETLKSQGKIRAYGVCNFAVQDLVEMLSLSQCETDQLPYNLAWRGIERAVLPLCQEHDIGVICYSPLAQGVLTGRYTNSDDVPEGLARTRHYRGDRPMAKHGEAGCEEELFATVSAIQGIAADLGEPMAAVALAWVRQQPGIMSLLVGARNPDEVQKNLPSIALILPDDILQELARVTEPLKEALGETLDMWFVPGRMR